MDRREREAILGEWGVGYEPARRRAEARELEADLENAALLGRPLRQRVRNFTLAVDTYLTSLGGPLPYMRRLRQIEDETAAHEATLAEAYAELSAACDGSAEEFAARWRDIAAGWSFHAVNELIDKHNRYFPIEARLPMDPRTGDFALVNGRPYRRAPLDARWVLERFPPEA